MGKIYAREIMKENGYTIQDVPNLWLAKTLAAFEEFAGNGTITHEQYEQYVGKPYEAA